jgi:hypothetical protein
LGFPQNINNFSNNSQVTAHSTKLDSGDKMLSDMADGSGGYGYGNFDDDDDFGSGSGDGRKCLIIAGIFNLLIFSFPFLFFIFSVKQVVAHEAESIKTFMAVQG